MTDKGGKAKIKGVDQVSTSGIISSNFRPNIRFFQFIVVRGQMEFVCQEVFLTFSCLRQGWKKPVAKIRQFCQFLKKNWQLEVGSRMCLEAGSQKFSGFQLASANFLINFFCSNALGSCTQLNLLDKIKFKLYFSKNLL